MIEKGNIVAQGKQVKDKSIKSIDLNTVLYKADKLGIKVDFVKSKQSVINNKIKRINADRTINADMKKVMIKDMFKKDGNDFLEAMKSISNSISDKLESFKKDTYTNKLSATQLTADEKILLPMVKEQFEKNSKLSDKDGYNRQLLFLANNGLISDITSTLDARTPPEIMAAISDTKKTNKYFNNVFNSISDDIVKVINDSETLEIEKSIYTGDK